jgi:hypothetical protein
MDNYRTLDAKRIVEDIIKDISNRNGLGNEWDMIDPSIRDQIKERWEKIILEYI